MAPRRNIAPRGELLSQRRTREVFMVDELRKFATSSNGDRWFLGRDAETGSAFVLHKANRPSGGKVTELPIEAFLSGP